jgi:hypothetical protein
LGLATLGSHSYPQCGHFILPRSALIDDDIIRRRG